MNLTIAQLKEACNKYPYIVCRDGQNRLHAFNTKVTRIIYKRMRVKPDNTETRYVSFRPCSFAEYISRKLPLYFDE